MFAKINLILDKLKLLITLYRFRTLCLYIIYYFYYILKETIFKGSLFNSLSFKSKIDFTFLNKVFRVKKIPRTIGNWVFAKIVTRLVEQIALKVWKIFGIGKTLQEVFRDWFQDIGFIDIIIRVVG